MKRTSILLVLNITLPLSPPLPPPLPLPLPLPPPPSSSSSFSSSSSSSSFLLLLLPPLFFLLLLLLFLLLLFLLQQLHSARAERARTVKRELQHTRCTQASFLKCVSSTLCLLFLACSSCVSLPAVSVTSSARGARGTFLSVPVLGLERVREEQHFSWCCCGLLRVRFEGTSCLSSCLSSCMFAQSHLVVAGGFAPFYGYGYFYFGQVLESWRTWARNLHIFAGLKRTWVQKLSSGWMMSSQLESASLVSLR